MTKNCRYRNRYETTTTIMLLLHYSHINSVLIQYNPDLDLDFSFKISLVKLARVHEAWLAWQTKILVTARQAQFSTIIFDYWYWFLKFFVRRDPRLAD